MHKGNHDQAAQILELLEKFCIERGTLYVVTLHSRAGLEIYTVSMKLCQAENHMLAMSHISALPYALACITLSERYHLAAVGAAAKVG